MNNIPTTLQGGGTGSTRFLHHASGPSQVQNEDKKQDKCESLLPIFKARPVNQKVLSSKGDVGVYRSTKREPTIPIEFKFSTYRRYMQDARRYNQDAPTELFDKLSLDSEMPKAPSRSDLVWPFHGDAKGAKENTGGCVQQGKKDIRSNKESQGPEIQVQHINFGTTAFSDHRSYPNGVRNFGIR